jgi:hypothetical protein
MIGSATKTAAASAIVAIALALFLSPNGKHRVLDAHGPIAADGSMIAGGAQTIFDTNPAYRERPHADPDDPKDFEQRIKDEKWGTDHSRESIAQLVGRSTGHSAKTPGTSC